MSKRNQGNKHKNKPERRRQREARRTVADRAPSRRRTPLVVIGVVAIIASAVYVVFRSQDTSELIKVSSNSEDPSELAPAVPGAPHSERRSSPEYALFRAPPFARSHSFNYETVLVWGGDHEMADGLRRNPHVSNIGRSDYAGANSCRSCHAENHAKWSHHSHRWMNVLANDESVQGDFSGQATARIAYRGGLGEFYRTGDDFMMRLSRDGTVREFKINRTLGSRIHQYYVGVMVRGPEPVDHEYRSKDHVLPFGYELTLKEWIPIVHAAGQQGPDSERDDPFETPSRLPYDTSCSMCHTTPPAGNLMLAMFKRFAAYTPRKLHFEGSNYVDEYEPGSVRLNLRPGDHFNADNLKYHLNDLAHQSHELLAQENAVNLGISCEACHLGSKAHVENEQIKPPFFPAGPYVHASGNSDQEVWGRTAANQNFICARCHSGARPQFAAGMAIWNSTEYTDAMRGHCYHPQLAERHGMESLTCISCHDPHETIGRRWTKTAQQDNESCIRCHTQFRDEQTVLNHTHHPVASSGSDCMNCHMPRINEGMGDMVRTHAIFSPTNVKMLEANQPNACNMCHVEESIDWTLGYLRNWYGLKSEEDAGLEGSYSDALISGSYPHRDKSAALGWLSSAHSGTRLVGSDVLIKAKAQWALNDVLRLLDDPYMEIRQFTVQRLRDYFGINTDDYDYKLYMTKEERAEPVRRMIDELGSPTADPIE